MLELAVLHKDELLLGWQKCLDKEHFKYYSYPCYEYTLKIDDNAWDRLQYVSIGSDGDVLGYFSASIDRGNVKISSIAVFNLTGKPNLIFSRDFYTFLTGLFLKFNFRKVEFFCCAKNPAVSLYRKIIHRFGGREIGRFTDSALVQGVCEDEIFFEILQTEFLNTYPKQNV